MKRRKLFRIISLSVISLSMVTAFLISCKDRDGKRSFSEKNGMDSPVKANEIKVSGDAAAAVASGQLQWELPQGWKAFPGSGMHLAILKTSSDATALECTIASLQGDAGGLQGNTMRWLGQLGLTLPVSEVDKFLAKQEKFQTRGGFELTLLDFNTLVNVDSELGMLMGVTKPGENTYFIKMMGSKAQLIKVKKDFQKFCQSLSVQ